MNLVVKRSDFNFHLLAAEVRAGEFHLCFCVMGGCYTCNSVEKL